MVEKQVEKTVEDKPKEKWMIGQVATATEEVIVNTETGEAYKDKEILISLMNTQEKILKLLEKNF